MGASAKPLLTPRRVALGALALGVAGVSGVLVAAYLQRQAIGVRLAVDYLRAHGVPAEMHLDRLDLNGAAGSMRLGPWWRPDLVVPHMEMSFKALPSPGKGLQAPEVRALRLDQPILRVRLRDGRLDFGSLQPLIDQASHAKPNGAPPPDLYIRDGRLVLDTPAGRLSVVLDGALVQGRLRNLHARLEPVDLAAAGVKLADVQGVLSGQSDGAGHLHLTAAFGAARGHGRGGIASGLTLNLEAATPDGVSAAGVQSRPVDATLGLKIERLSLPLARGGPLRVQGGGLALDLDGALDGANRFKGRLHAAGRAQALSGDGASLRAIILELTSPAARARLQDGRFVGGGPFAFSMAGEDVRAATPAGSVLLQTVRLSAAGQAEFSRAAQVEASGALQAAGGLARPDAERLARRALGGVDPGAAQTLADTLQHAQVRIADYGVSYTPQSAVLRLPQGAVLTLPRGAATVRPEGRAAILQISKDGRVEGALSLSLRIAGLPQVDLNASRYRLYKGSVDAQVRLAASGGLGPVQAAAVTGSAVVTSRAGTWSVAAEGCPEMAAGALRSGAKVVASGVTARLCPIADAPLVTFGPAAWRARGRVEQAAFVLPEVALRGRLAAADVSLSGGRGNPAGHVGLQGLALQDASPAPRVKPLSVDGGLSLGGGEATGRLHLSLTQGGASLGDLALRDNVSTGAGEASFASGPLRFGPKGLQAADIAPALAKALPQAQGALALSARAAWTRAGIAASSGEVQSDGLSFKSPAGRIDGLKGALRFSSLIPLRTAGMQALSADKLETVLPLTALKAEFSLSPAALDLNAASARVAQGEAWLDPMRVPLGPHAGPASGVVRLKGISLQSLISAFNLSNAVSIQARVDGELPFVLAEPGGGLAAAGGLKLGPGRVYAEGPGRLTIQRQALGGAVTTAGAAGAQPNAVQDFAYQALENLAFTQLEADVASRAGGRLGIVFHIVGRHDPAVAPPTRIGLFQLLRGHAFDKPLPLPKGTPVDLTLDTSLNLDDLLAAYGALNAPSGSAKVQP